MISELSMLAVGAFALKIIDYRHSLDLQRFGQHEVNLTESVRLLVLSSRGNLFDILRWRHIRSINRKRTNSFIGFAFS